MSLLDITGLSHSYGDSRLYSDSDLSLNEWMMTNQFYDILLSNGFYTDLEAYKADPANRPLIDENTGEWIEIPDISELL